MPFFTDVLELRDADIHELLADLVLMQEMKRDDLKQVYRLYERIESCHRIYAQLIKHIPMTKA